MIHVGLDSEFLPKDLTPIGLISIGLVYYTPGGEEFTYYAINGAMDARALHTGENRDWMVEHVWNKLPTRGKTQLDTDHPDVKDYGTIRREVDAFLKGAASFENPEEPSRDDIELVVNCGSQDVVRLHTLMCGNNWVHMPPWVPLAADDVYRVKRKAYRLGMSKEEIPRIDEEQAHHALYDAQYELGVFRHIQEEFGDI